MEVHSINLVPVYKLILVMRIPHISVGFEINKLGLVMRVGFLIYQLDLRTISWVLYQRVGSLIFN
jgi:hypothetical protein